REPRGEFRILQTGRAQPHAGIQHHGVDVVAVGVAEHSLDRSAIDVGRLADPVLGWAAGARAGVFGIVAALDPQPGSAVGTGRDQLRPALHGLDRERWVFRDVPIGIDDLHNSLPSAGVVCSVHHRRRHCSQNAGQQAVPVALTRIERGRPCNTAVMAYSIARPKLEGNIAVGDDRQLGFAEFGDPQGRAIFWLHGTPGARRQIPTEARGYAEHHNIRLIGIDRPGIGSSPPQPYENILAFAQDRPGVAGTLGIDKMAVVGLSGGGPYSLACAAALPDLVVAVAVLGGVAPTQGPEAISGGAMNPGLRVAPLLKFGGS